MWRDLASVWPSPFAEELTVPPGMLVAHGGVAQLAELALTELAPYLLEVPPDMHITLAGHSLGGAFAQLLCCLATLKLGRWVAGGGSGLRRAGRAGGAGAVGTRGACESAREAGCGGRAAERACSGLRAEGPPAALIVAALPAALAAGPPGPPAARAARPS
jgi:hypothetical protein